MMSLLGWEGILPPRTETLAIPMVLWSECQTRLTETQVQIQTLQWKLETWNSLSH